MKGLGIFAINSPSIRMHLSHQIHTYAIFSLAVHTVVVKGKR